MDEKKQKDAAFVDRKSSQRIQRLISKEGSRITLGYQAGIQICALFTTSRLPVARSEAAGSSKAPTSPKPTSGPPGSSVVQCPDCPLFKQPPRTFRSPTFRLHYHGMVSFPQRVNVPVGPSGPSRATRATSRDPSSTEAVPSY